MDPINSLASALADRYRIERELGAGGMATVHLARDLRHDRDVAIKVLHPDLGAALGGDRFLAEIKTTAKLQHPHILPLLDSGEADGLLYYVMPLVDGETLRARLERQRQLSIEDALRIASEIAGAIDYAHRQGVIHRDIKPENILLHDGRAVVADFGIALAVSAASGPRMTQTGLSLGTPQYMSPEQAMGERHIDGRADIYALGAVVYEMLTGEPPFTGATVQAIVAKVLTERPTNPTAVRDTVPKHVEAAVFKALAKLPADRFETAAGFADALARPGSASFEAPPARAMPHRGAQRLTVGALAAALAVAGGLAAWGWLRPLPSDTTELTLPVALDNVRPVIAGAAGFAISRDGRAFVFCGTDSSRVPRLFVRYVDKLGVQAIPGTAFAVSASLSPDGSTVAFSRASGLYTVPLTGGEPRLVSGITNIRTFDWGADGSIVFAANSGLWRLASAAGIDTVVQIAMNPTGRTFNQPSIASKNLILFVVASGGAEGPLGALDTRDGKIQMLGPTGLKPTLVDGNLLTWGTADGSLMAADFDAGALKLSGRPRPVLVGASDQLNAWRLAIAPNGRLTYLSAFNSTQRSLVVMDRSGRTQAIGATNSYRYPRFSPDGRRVVVETETRGIVSGDISVVSIADGSMLRLTTDSASFQPAWDPSGKAVIFPHRWNDERSASSPKAPSGIGRIAADGSGNIEKLLVRQATIYETEMTPDGRFIAWREDAGVTSRDIYFAALDSPATAIPVATSGFDERSLTISPDGKWIAYVSNETGTNEVYVKRLQANSPRWRVTPNGGMEPRWSRNGQIYFRGADSVFSARVQLGDDVKVGSPEFVLTGRFETSLFEALWDVSADGQRFVFVRAPEGISSRLVYVANWQDRWRKSRP